MNTSWVLIANFICVFVCLRTAGYVNPKPVGGSPLAAEVIIAFVGGGGAIFALVKMDPLWALVASWALYGIYRQHTDKNAFPSHNKQLGIGAAVGSVFCILASLVSLARLCCRTSRPAAPLSQSQPDE